MCEQLDVHDHGGFEDHRGGGERSGETSETENETVCKGEAFTQRVRPLQTFGSLDDRCTDLCTVNVSVLWLRPGIGSKKVNGEHSRRRSRRVQKYLTSALSQNGLSAAVLPSPI